jgi:cytochrome c oxidase subunit 4
MSSAEAGEFKKQVRVYVIVFAALLALTLMTVTISYLRLGIIVAVVAALVIATMKGSLVASFFMHLISEKRLVHLALILTTVVLLALLFLPLTAYYDRIGP